jgi:large subunit ribosomal protein L10
MAGQATPQKRDKSVEVATIKKAWTKASSVVLLGFKGLTVPAVTDLRTRFRKGGVEYKVFKNTLVLQALKGTPLEGNKELEKVLKGETGVAFSFEDPSAAAKIVRDFRKEKEADAEKLQVKAGVLDTSIVAGKDVESKLASMPGKDEVRAMLLATLQAPMQKLLQTLQAPSQHVVYALEAQRKKLAGE